MDRQPTLEGERLVLRPLRAGDRDALFAVACDPLLWAQHPIHDRWRRDVFDAFFDEALGEGGALVATLREDGRVIGSSQFRPCPIASQEMEIGWTFIGRDCWGSGLNPEMKRLMLAHALSPETAGVPRVLFRIGEDNTRSRMAIEAIGGALTAMVDQGEYKGRPVRHVVYQITRAGFAEGPLAASR